MTSKEYADHNGEHCPVCRSSALSGSSVDVRGGTAVQEVTCNDCDASWEAVYTLVGYCDLEHGEA